MYSSWPTAPFGSVLGEGTRNGIHKGKQFQGRGVPIIKMGEAYDSMLIGDRERDLLDLSEKEKGKLLVRDGDLLFCRTSLVAEGVGKPALVRDLSEPATFASNLIRVRLDSDLGIPYFYLHFFRSPLGVSTLLTIARGTSVTTITGGDLKKLEVPVPPLAEQCRIAAVLGALDDRIEVNRRMNRTLEAMAQALFRRRFVDFDGHDELVESERGPIPPGWRWGKPIDLIEFDPRMKLKKGTVARYLGMSEVPTEGFDIGELEDRPYKGGSKFLLGDTLLARITPSLENGKTALVDFLQPDEVAFGSTEFIVMRGRDSTPREYVYCLARSPEFRDFAIQHMTGSSGRQRVKREHFDHYDLAIPPHSVLVDFGEAARPMFDRISANHRQSRTLAALRDALLPKLVSGEIRVPEAEAAIEEIA